MNGRHVWLLPLALFLVLSNLGTFAFSPSRFVECPSLSLLWRRRQECHDHQRNEPKPRQSQLCGRQGHGTIGCKYGDADDRLLDVKLIVSRARAIGVTMAFIGLSLSSWPALCYSTSPNSYQGNFGSDRVVEIETPLALANLRLVQPKLLGAGSGGAVFSMMPADSNNLPNTPLVAVKFSWVTSAGSVANECKVLQELERNHVHNVERCLAMDRYPNDTRRVIIALEPVFVDDSSSLGDIRDAGAMRRATTRLMQTLVEMLAARVVMTDVQLLVAQSGQALLVDLTEAKLLPMPMSDIDMALANSFCSEMLSQVPPAMYTVADAALTELLETNHLEDDLYTALMLQRDILNS